MPKMLSAILMDARSAVNEFVAKWLTDVDKGETPIDDAAPRGAEDSLPRHDAGAVLLMVVVDGAEVLMVVDAAAGRPTEAVAAADPQTEAEAGLAAEAVLPDAPHPGAADPHPVEAGLPLVARHLEEAVPHQGDDRGPLNAEGPPRETEEAEAGRQDARPEGSPRAETVRHRRGSPRLKRAQKGPAAVERRRQRRIRREHNNRWILPFLSSVYII